MTDEWASWSRLLDRLEERLRLIEASVLPHQGPAVEIGPAVTDADLPAEPPTADERLRLHALAAGHDRVLDRLEGRRRSLRRSQHYRLAGA